MTMRIIIAGGGTGGHVFPGIALAEEFMTRHNENDVLFVGTERGLEKDAVPRAGFPIEFIDVSGLNRVGLGKMVKSLFRLPKAIWQSMRIIRRYRPGIVVAVGGYASGPVALAAWLLRVPVVVQEQNALPGFTTRTVGKFARRVFVAFERAAEHFPRGKVVLTGNPIRQALMENFLRPQDPHDDARPQVLAFGGSQGARALNQALVGAFGLLVERHPGIHLVHQTGAREHADVVKAYEAAGVTGRVEVLPFIHDMSAVYARSDLVVCRAGATTLAELTVTKKASILVPFPFAADNHQEFNARALADAGAAVLLPEGELTPERLAEEVGALLADPERRRAMERAAGLFGHPEAAKEIADVCVEIWVRSGGLVREQRALPKGGA